jgi:hypothetical protein
MQKYNSDTETLDSDIASALYFKLIYWDFLALAVLEHDVENTTSWLDCRLTLYRTRPSASQKVGDGYNIMYT